MTQERNVSSSPPFPSLLPRHAGEIGFHGTNAAQAHLQIGLRHAGRNLLHEGLLQRLPLPNDGLCKLGAAQAALAAIARHRPPLQIPFARQAFHMQGYNARL